MPAPTLIPVFSRHRHPRLRYVLRELGRDLGYDLRLMTDEKQWAGTEAGAKIALAEVGGAERHLRLPAHKLLKGGAPSAADLEVTHRDDVFAFFPVGNEFDLLACTFFHLSRYEEYQPFTPDAHGRFPAGASHALANGYLHRPVVREYAALLARRLAAVFPTLTAPKTHAWNFRPTYDIDILWAFHHRGPRGLAAGARDFLTGHARRAWRRFAAAPAQDPFFSLDFLHALHGPENHSLHPASAPEKAPPPAHEQEALKPIWFWLLTDRKHPHDVNPYPIPPEQRAIIGRLAKTDTVGIHPGYRAAETPAALREEIERLATITGRGVSHSRQHFLRLRFPETYRMLRNAGITHDYTMGYADAAGWRAGTNLPFSWYDLEREETTGLTVHPFAAMDATLRSYLGLSPAEARDRVLGLAAGVRPFGGDFQLLWHNSSFDELFGWGGWQGAYAEMVRALRR